LGVDLAGVPGIPGFCNAGGIVAPLGTEGRLRLLVEDGIGFVDGAGVGRDFGEPLVVLGSGRAEALEIVLGGGGRAFLTVPTRYSAIFHQVTHNPTRLRRQDRTRP
jgi:hypothetical protein